VYEAGGPSKEEKQARGNKKQVPGEEVVTPDTFVALPAEWVAQLGQGAEEADIERLSSVIAQIRERDAAVADALARLVENFAYDEIMALTQNYTTWGKNHE
jgi:hypothetical protein